LPDESNGIVFIVKSGAKRILYSGRRAAIGAMARAGLPPAAAAEGIFRPEQ
jgi:hypothetical protein